MGSRGHRTGPDRARRGTLLLEALDATTDLSSLDLDTACHVAGGVLARLHVPAPPGLTTVADFVSPYLDAMAHRPDLMPRRGDHGTDSAFRRGVRHRLEIVCEAAGIDEEIARRWSIVTTAVEAWWALTDGDRDTASFQLSLGKALDD